MNEITEYIARQDPEQQSQLTKVYELLARTLPDAKQTISYGIPAFMQPKAIIYFGASKHHLGIYPTGEGIAYFADELKDYPTSKGSWHIAYDKPLPEDLIVKMAKHRLEVVTKG